MGEIPPVSNVFGYLHSRVGLRAIAATLCSKLGLTEEQVRLRRGSSDGTETLLLETAACSLETRAAQRADTWSFSGAVAGTPEEIFETLSPLVQVLTHAGFNASFEIYDADFRFVGECPRRHG